MSRKRRFPKNIAGNWLSNDIGMITEKTGGKVCLPSVFNKERTCAQTWRNAWSSALHIYVSAYMGHFCNPKLLTTGQLFQFMGITCLSPSMKETQPPLMGQLLFGHEAMCSDKPDSKFTSPLTSTGGEPLRTPSFGALSKRSARRGRARPRVGNKQMSARKFREKGAALSRPQLGTLRSHGRQPRSGAWLHQMCAWRTWWRHTQRPTKYSASGF